MIDFNQQKSSYIEERGIFADIIRNMSSESDLMKNE